MQSNLTEVRPFRLEIPQGEIDELRRRIDATRWPTRELVVDRSQGVQLAAIQHLARYWTTEYDWRRCEARLNALPQFKTEIDGLDIHFIHVKSAHENALPLIMTHGWPGSVVELLEMIDPTAHGGRAEDAFHLVLPSIPGYGFSDEPTELGWGPIRIGQAWAGLMRRLGYTRYVAQGGDVGSQVTDAMGRLGLDGLIGNPHQPSHAGARRCRGPERVTALGRRTCHPRRARPNSMRPALGISWNRRHARKRLATPSWTPVGFTTFPGETWRTPRSWVEKAYPMVIYFNEVDKGGHFAAWEEPGLFSEELRAAFRSLR